MLGRARQGGGPRRASDSDSSTDESDTDAAARAYVASQVRSAWQQTNRVHAAGHSFLIHDRMKSKSGLRQFGRRDSRTTSVSFRSPLLIDAHSLDGYLSDYMDELIGFDHLTSLESSFPVQYRAPQRTPQIHTPWTATRPTMWMS